MKDYQPGTRVAYNGSIVAAHGTWVVLGECECDACEDNYWYSRWCGSRRDLRYALASSIYDDPQITHVRPASITPVA